MCIKICKYMASLSFTFTERIILLTKKVYCLPVGHNIIAFIFQNHRYKLFFFNMRKTVYIKRIFLFLFMRYFDGNKKITKTNPMTSYSDIQISVRKIQCSTRFYQRISISKIQDSNKIDFKTMLLNILYYDSKNIPYLIINK